jgi:lactaldehyde dehydrogenase/glycolaldehyde dehydrogenase
VERVYVHRAVKDAFIDRITRLMRETRYGDPLAMEDLHMGPLINRTSLEKVAAMVGRARDAGAEIVTGGKQASVSPGHHYEPTVIVDCRADMEIMQKEIFGPVLPIQTVDNVEEAISLANDSDYGLTSSIFTNDLNTAMRASRDLRFGETYINRENFEAMQGFHAGRRKSGIGGADGKHGLYEYMETQAIYLQHG